MLKKPGSTHCDIGTAQSVEARLSVLEKENAVLRKELAKMTACAHECPRCSGLTSEPERTARKGRSDSARLAALERRVEEIGPSIIRAIEERFRGRHHSPEGRRGTSHSSTRCTTQTTSLPKEQKNGEWKVVESKSSRRKENKRRATAGEAAKKGAIVTPPARGQQSLTRMTGAPRTSIVAPKNGPAQTPKTAILPRTPRTSAVSVTLNEGSRISYADVINTAGQSILLAEIGVESLNMRKMMTDTIVIMVLGDRDREKASRLATRLAKVLDPATARVTAPTRTAELRVVEIDISINKEELWQALAQAAGCGCAEVSGRGDRHLQKWPGSGAP